MRLSEELRDELAAVGAARACDRLAQLSGLFHTAGSVHIRSRGNVSVHLDLAASAAARRAFALLRSFGVRSEIRSYPRRPFDRATRYQLRIGGDDHALQVLHEAGVLTASLAPLEVPPRRLVARACCRGAYVRGALLGAGSLSAAPATHLEIRTTSSAGAEFLASLAPLGVAERRGHAAAYAKGRDAIAAVLAAAGASGTVLTLEERAVMGATRARANRLANADHANLVRTSRAAHAQLEAVRRLEQEGLLEDLPPRVREIAELRRRHPGLSMRELALKSRPPTTKAAVQRRLARLVRLAQR